MAEFRMPSLGADMTEGTLLEWLVHPGDTVHRGDIIAVVDTVKTAIDVESFEDGTVERLLVEPGTTVRVGTPLAELGGAVTPSRGTPLLPEPTEPQGMPAPTALTGPPPASPVVRHLARERGVDLGSVVGHGPDGAVTRRDVEEAGRSATPVEPSRPPVKERRVTASPLARRRAAELGVDLAALSGTGPRGAVTVADVEAATAGAAPSVAVAPSPTAPTPSLTAPAPSSAATASRAADVGTAQRRAAMQAATAALMSRSKREIPHFYLERAIDLAAASEWLTRHNEGRASSERVLLSALLLIATARTLRAAAPELNGFVTDAGPDPRENVDLGVAVSMRSGGLLVATIAGVDALPLDEFMARLKDVGVRARAGRLRSSETATPTVTVTNLGDQGADLVHGVIYPPQAALVGFGRVAERPWAVDGMLTVRPVVVATLAGDHRVSDGHRGSRFLTALDAALQRPEEL